VYRIQLRPIPLHCETVVPFCVIGTKNYPLFILAGTRVQQKSNMLWGQMSTTWRRFENVARKKSWKCEEFDQKRKRKTENRGYIKKLEKLSDTILV